MASTRSEANVTTCSICRQQTPTEALDRLSGLDVCGRCRRRDPAACLREQGLPIEWRLLMGRFCVGAGIGPVEAPEFTLRFTPQLARHAVVKLVVREVEVGDPIFDDRIYVRTSDPERAAALLADEGLQSAVLALLSDVKLNELKCNYIALEGPRLEVVVRPLAALDPDHVARLQLEAAALALQLRSGLRGAGM